MNLLQLPTEILVEILLYQNVPDAYAIQALNRFFLNLYKTSLDLQYALECKIAGVRDNPNCRLSIPERLQMLRERESAWKSVTPTSSMTIKPPPTGYLTGNLQPYHYMMYKYCVSEEELFPRGEFHISSLRDINKYSFHSIRLENVVQAGSCIDEHDLIAYLTWANAPESQIELKLVLLQHSTGKPHPLALEPNILVYRDVISDTRYKFSTSHLQIFGENLVLTLNKGPMATRDLGRMYVYNWKTGEAKCKEPIQVPCAENVVLDHNLIIVPTMDAWCLSIYYIPSSSSRGSVKMIQQLELPPSRTKKRPLWIRCRSLPNPTGDGQFPKHVSSSTPFMDDPDTALIHITICGPVSLLVHRQSIMKLLPLPEDWTKVTEPPIKDWSSWGPPVSALRSGLVGTTYGQRSLMHQEGSRGTICDFNAYHVRRSARIKEPGPYEPYGAKPVITKLSCVETMSPSHSIANIADGVAMSTKWQGGGSYTRHVLYFGY